MDPRVSEEDIKKAVDWLINGEIGVSSECLCAALFGVTPKYIDVPHDSSDFERCDKFLELFDEDVQDVIWENVVELSDLWYVIAYKWDDIYKLYAKNDHNGVQSTINSIRTSHWVKNARVTFKITPKGIEF